MKMKTFCPSPVNNRNIPVDYKWELMKVGSVDSSTVLLPSWSFRNLLFCKVIQKMKRTKCKRKILLVTVTKLAAWNAPKSTINQTWTIFKIFWMISNVFITRFIFQKFIILNDCRENWVNTWRTHIIRPPNHTSAHEIPEKHQQNIL